MPVGVGVPVSVGVPLGVGVGVRDVIGVGVGVVLVVVAWDVGDGLDGVGPEATVCGVGVRIGAKVTTGTTTSVPLGDKGVKAQGGGVITSGRSGATCNSPVSEPGSGSNSESITAGISHARPGLNASCAVHKRQIKASNSIRKNTSKSRRSRSSSRLGS